MKLIQLLKAEIIKYKSKRKWDKINRDCVYGKLFCKSPTYQFSRNGSILNLNIFNLTNDKSKIRFGDYCNIAATIVLREKGSITVGNYVYMNRIHLNIQYHLSIGSYCMFGPNVKIWDSKDHPLDKLDRRNQLIKKLEEGIIDSYEAGGGDIIIGDDVWVGMDSIIMGGVTIGNGSVVAAGSIVTRSVPENVLVGGVPARIIKHL